MVVQTTEKSFISKIRKRLSKYTKHKRITMIGIIMIVIGIACIGISGWKTYMVNKSRIVNLRMEDIGELSTQAAYFTNVQMITNSREVFGVTVPFTQSKYIYSYDGVIRAGIDFTKLTYTIDSNANRITIYLPEAYITSVSVDEESLEVYDESKNIFTPLKLSYLQESRVKMEEEAIQQAIANGLLGEATENAKLLIKSFLLSNEDLANHDIVWETITKGE